MWADGVYMASPFLAKFAAVFGEPAALDDAVKQVLLAEAHLRDAKTGLLFHGWDESRKAALGEPDDRTVVAALGARRRLVRDGGRRRARRDAARTTRGGARSSPSCGGSPRAIAPGSGQGDRRLVAGAGRGRARRQLQGGVGLGDVRLCADEGGEERLARREDVRPVAARGCAGVRQPVRRRRRRGRRARQAASARSRASAATPTATASYEYYVGTEVVEDDPKGVGAFILAAAEQP